MEALTRGIVNKIIHTPISTLKTAARDPESTTVVESRAKALQSEEIAKRTVKKRDCQPIEYSSRSAELMARLRIGSRGSQLALWQAHHISDLLRAQGHPVELEIIKTTGDKITDVALAKVGTKGMFTKEIEEALIENRVDLAVHSLKDLPTELASDFEIAAITARENPRDVFVR